MKHKIIVALCVLVLTITNTVVTVHATEIENGNLLAEVTPPVALEDVQEVTVLGTIADMITANGVNFDFSDYNGTYEDFISYIYDTIENASYGAQDFVQNQLQNTVNGVIEWIRNTFTNRTNFGSASNYALQMFNIASQLYPEDDTPTPEPDINYSSYIDTINGTGFYIRNYNNGIRGGNNGYMQEYYPNYEYTWTTVNNNVWGTNGSGSPLVAQGEITTANIIGENNSYTCTIILNCYNGFNGYYGSENHYYTGQIRTSFDNQTNIIVGENRNHTTNGVISRTVTGTLTEVFQYLARLYRNINIYVNGVPWSIVSTSTPNKIIYSADNLKYNDSNTPIHVIFPTGTYLDYEALKQIIQDIIDSKDVLTYNQIKDTFVDYEGQQALAVYQVNYYPDDDTINVMYPTQPLFSEFENDLSEMGGASSNGVALFTLLYTVVPVDVWGALCFGALIVFFACLIKRMLE